jgi:hypothetical protein
VHALGLSVFTTRLPETDLNPETSTSKHYEVFLPFLVQLTWNLGTQLKFISAASGLALYNRGTDNAENTVLLLRCADHTEKTSHVFATQVVHWRADWYLGTSSNFRPQRRSFHCCALERVYGAVAGNALIKSVTILLDCLRVEDVDFGTLVVIPVRSALLRRGRSNYS